MNRSMIFAVISSLIVLTINSSFSSLEVSGAKTTDLLCLDSTFGKIQCCQSEYDSKGNFVALWCTTCDNTNPPSNCTPREKAAPEPNPGEELLSTLQPGIFKDPTTVTPKLDQEQDEKTGGDFEPEESNDTISALE